MPNIVVTNNNTQNQVNVSGASQNQIVITAPEAPPVVVVSALPSATVLIVTPATLPPQVIITAPSALDAATLARVKALEAASTSSWIALASSYRLAPTLSATIAAGAVYAYTYATATLYRLVPDPYVLSDDAFYSAFDGTDLSGLVVSRALAI